MKRYTGRETDMREFIARFNEIKSGAAPAPRYDGSFEQLKALAMETGWTAGIMKSGESVTVFDSADTQLQQCAACEPAERMDPGSSAQYGATEAVPDQSVQPNTGIVFRGIVQGRGCDVKNTAGTPVITLAGGHSYLIMAAVSGTSPAGLEFQLRLNGVVSASFGGSESDAGGFQTVTDFNFLVVRVESGSEQLQFVNASAHPVDGLRASVAILEIV